MAEAWLRRKAAEADLVAMQVMRYMAIGMGGASTAPADSDHPSSPPPQPQEGQRQGGISVVQLLNEMSKPTL